MTNANVLILIAVLLPPRALEVLGDLVQERTVSTPYGEVGPLGLRVTADNLAVWVQPYMGLSTHTDPRATIYAARQLGIAYILNWDIGIALNPVLKRGQTLVTTDYIDWAHTQPHTFGDVVIREQGIEQNLRQPAFCPQMVAALHGELPFAVDVVYLGVDGPRRETPAEARLFRQWGADVLGQNLVPEVILANELGLCYAGLVTVGDRGADQTAAPSAGEMRAGLAETVQALPRIGQRLAAMPVCNCGYL